MGECENLANLKLTIKEIQRKLVEGCECAAKSFKSEYSGFSAEQCLLLGVGAMFFGALLGIQGFAFYKRAVTRFLVKFHVLLPQTSTGSDSDMIVKDKEEEAEGDLGTSRTFVLDDYSLRESSRMEDESPSSGLSSTRSKVLGPCNAWLWQ